jgi:predicted amidohydrolase
MNARSPRENGRSLFTFNGGLPLKTKIIIVLALAGCSQQHPTQSVPTPTTQSTVRVAGIVLKWIIADKEANYRRVEPLIREAAAKGAQIVMTTECFLDGYAIQDKSIPLEKWWALCEPIPDGPYVKKLRDLAAELRIHLVAGLTECDGENTYNTALLINPDGKIIGKYHKHKLEHESVRNTPGSSYPVFDTQFGKIGLMICADRREPELVKQLKANGAQMLLCPSGGMWGPKDNDPILQARSRENNIDIVFVHPIEFLVTDGAGDIVNRHFVGEDMVLKREELSGPKDQRLVVIYDLSLTNK